MKTLHAAGGDTLVVEYGSHSGKLFAGVLDQIECRSVTAKVTPGVRVNAYRLDYAAFSRECRLTRPAGGHSR